MRSNRRIKHGVWKLASNIPGILLENDVNCSKS
jgi:hypothetical protein